MGVTLQDKFFGCIAGAYIGSSMGAIVEGWPYQKITETYGELNELKSYEHPRVNYEGWEYTSWIRPPGTTEDGIERQKLMITAIIEKQDRVNAEDVKAIWIRDINPPNMAMICTHFEPVLHARAKTGLPARDMGQY